MLHKLKIENFQSIRQPVEIEFRPLTFIYGPNSVGKSAVFDALDVLGRVVRRDPTAQSQLERSNRPEYVELSDDLRGPWVGTSECMTLSISAYADDKTSTVVSDYHHLISDFPVLWDALQRGFLLEVKVQFQRRGSFEEPKFLTIKINDEEILNYQSCDVNYDPYYQTTSNQQTGVELKRNQSLHGELRVKRNYLNARNELIASTNSVCARRKLAISDDGDWMLVRGVAVSLYGRKQSAEISIDADQLIFAFKTWEELLAWKQDELQQWNLVSPKNNPKYLEEFLAQEFSDANSTRLLQDLRSVADQTSLLIDIIFESIAPSLTVNRVSGDRPPVQSNRPIHLRPRYAPYPDDSPNPTFPPQSSSVRYVAEDDGLFISPRGWGGTETDPKCSNDRLLASYANSFLRTARHGDAEHEDFPNFVLKNYLRSFSAYSFLKEEYLIIDRESFDNAQTPEDLQFMGYVTQQDTSSLSGTRIVYFSVKENPNVVRPFADVGSSLGFLLPVLLALSLDESAAIEEPELHLHPSAQEELADVFLCGRKLGRTVIIESHSEAFLVRIAQRLKETYDRGASANVKLTDVARRLVVRPEDIGIYVFSSERSSGATSTRINFACDGSLVDDWPSIMFDNSWSALLGRLSLFSQGITKVEVMRDWPWLSEVDSEDPQIAQWLVLCWQCKALGSGFDGTAIITISKIVERALAIRLFEGLGSVDLARGYFKDHEWREGLVSAQSGHRTPSIGWWKRTVFYLKRPAGEGEYVGLKHFRERIAAASWREQWESALSQQGLVHLLDSLIDLRSAAAHSIDKVNARNSIDDVRDLIYRGVQPGVLLCALGLVKQRKTPFKPRVV